jgi:hypothetical protein
LKGILETIDRIYQAGGVVISVSEGIDFETWQGRFMAQMLGALAEAEFENAKSTWRDIKLRNVADGVAAIPAWGYDKRTEGEWIDGRYFKKGTLVVNDNAPFVREIFNRRARGASDSSIAKWLNQENVPSATGTVWIPSSVRSHVGARTYLGETSWGEHVQKGTHEAIVSEAVFQAANNRPGLSPPRSKSHDTQQPLTGILRCAGCRSTLGVRRARPKGAVGGGAPAAYACSVSKDVCQARAYVRADVINDYVAECFKRNWAQQRLVFDQVGTGDEQFETAQAELAEAESWLAEFDGDLEIMRTLGKGRYLVVAAKMQEAVDEAQRHLDQVMTAISGRAVTEDLIASFDDLPVAQRRELYANTYGAIFVRGQGTGADGKRRQLPIAEQTWIVTRSEIASIELPRRGTHPRLGLLGPVPWPDRDPDGDGAVPEPQNGPGV